MQKLTYSLSLVLFYFLFNSFFSKSYAEKLPDDSTINHHVNYKQDFEEGHVDGWESYPPSQDSGFEPNFKCERVNDLNGSAYALMLQYPVTFVTENEMGFVKPIELLAADNSSVSFNYKINGYNDFSTMDIVLCSSNGNQYSYSMTAKDDGTWDFLNIPINNFKHEANQIQPGTKINGFYLVAHIPKTDPNVTYKMYLDNLSIKAEKLVEFLVEEPKTKYLENIDVVIPLKHYSIGEVLNLKASLPDGIELTSASITIIDPNGSMVLESSELVIDKNDKTWNGKNIYTFSEKDKLGRWTAILKGTNRDNQSIETEFKFWLTDKIQSHPIIYFTKEEIKKYQEKINDDHWQEWWDSLVVRAERTRNSANLGSITFGVANSSITETNPIKLSLESLRNVNLSVYDTVYLLPTLRHYFNIMVGAMKQLQENALIYAVTGDSAAGNYAKEALVIISGWDTWTHPWFTARHRETYYPVGEMGVRAAFCYDIVYPLLTEEERKKVTEGLLKNCIIPSYKEYVLENRIPSATSNWVGNTVSGGISAALAIYGDNPELGDLEPYISGLIKKLEMHINNTLGEEGAWGEGISYQGFSYSNSLPTITAIKNVLNLDLSSENIFNSYKYFLYNYSGDEILDVGDSHPSLSTLSNFAWISSNNEDPIFNWFYQQSPRKNILDFLFGNDKGKIESPDSVLPDTKLFPDVGAAIFRSGWDEDNILLNFRSGAFFNHQHFGQGMFQLRAFGETLIPEAGWAHYYNDPWYSRYYIQPIGHSTLLLDEKPGSQRSGDYDDFFISSTDKHAEITDFIATDFYSAATGEISDVYRGKLDLFERNIVFLNKKYFVIFDRLKSSQEPHEYDLLFHFEDSEEVTLDKNNIFTIETDKASLFSQVMFPEKINMEIVTGPVDLGVPIKKPGFVQVSNPVKSMEENFLTILYPKKGNKTSSNFSNLLGWITKLKGNNYIGISVNGNNQTDKLFFSSAANGITADKVLTDGRIAEVTLKDNKLSNFSAHDATNFSYEANKLIETDMPVTFSAELNQEIDKWKINSDKNGEVKILISSEPKTILINEIQVKVFKINDGKITLPVSKGSNFIEINY